MKTRKRKAAATASAEQEPDATSSLEVAEGSHSALSLEIPPEIDFESLSTILPDISLTSATPESILSLYKALLDQSSQLDATQRELDDARAEAERKDVELDQALQDRETFSKDLETSLQTAQAELNQLKQERHELGA